MAAKEKSIPRERIECKRKYNVARNIWKACLIVYKVILSTHDKIIKAQSIETYYMLKNTLSKEEDLFRYKKKSQMQKGVLKQILN